LGAPRVLNMIKHSFSCFKYYIKKKQTKGKALRKDLTRSKND
jgi:hypothetical protein